MSSWDFFDASSTVSVPLIPSIDGLLYLSKNSPTPGIQSWAWGWELHKQVCVMGLFCFNCYSTGMIISPSLWNFMTILLKTYQQFLTIHWSVPIIFWLLPIFFGVFPRFIGRFPEFFGSIVLQSDYQLWERPKNLWDTMNTGFSTIYWCVTTIFWSYPIYFTVPLNRLDPFLKHTPNVQRLC